ncbi:DUF4268 domain-containing protein [Micromonospora narathiwatensis]|uniref:DUF4268 domain-containing protein n=1 Tax=Micromonospora narathiwatensis TaxID=299146 RepID=A0A1A8Z9U9_9ACTN|nr:DUF4268 domain-containing protein [Micromonospora narathiwatensis]SBT40585.1 protein of unknown function (DUF4268) [Micromonospora narathiwatensis]
MLANADVLGELLGMDLVLSSAEHPVGGFSLDLIGVDEATNETVIIENQLTRTDHGHLGQLLTYAGRTDPVNVVWIATEFREEHRAALDWLNTRTDENTRFFGIEISAVRIGESVPAPLMRLVVQPNDWGKKVKAIAKCDTAASDRAMAYQEFWTRFLETVHDRKLGWTTSTKGSPQNWQSLPAGITGMSYTCTFGRSGPSSEIFFQHPDPAVNDARFAAARAKLEPAFEDILSYEPLQGRKGCRIAEYRKGDIGNGDDWVELLRLLLDEHDTAVTNATSHALLQRDDTHGVRLIAQAVAAATDEQLDHLYAALGQHLLPDGPTDRFITRCSELTQDPNPTISTGTHQLLTWTKPWAPST